MARREELSDEQWAIIEPLLGAIPRRSDGRGRLWRDNREVINGILWILRTGAPWADLPERFPPYQTCHRRFQLWVKDGTLRRILEALAEDLQSRGKFDLSECFIDGTFVSAKKGASELERPSGKGTTGMAVANGAGLPLAIYTDSASPLCPSGLSAKRLSTD